MDIAPVLLLVVAALAAGGVAGWFAGRSGSAGVRAELAAQRGLLEAERAAAEQRVAAVEAVHAARLEDERRGAAERLEHERTATAERLAAQQQLFTDRLEAERAAAAERLEAEQEAAAERLRSEQASARERLEAEQAAARERLEELKADSKRLSDEFESLSGKVLAASTKTFLEQAEERFKRAQQASESELAKREEAVKSLVEPLSRTLGEVKAEMTAAEKARIEAHSTLAEQVLQMRTSSEALRTETTQLVSALRAPQVRGRWGELQLRRVVEAAGMLEHVDFEEQESVTTDGGRLRPDLVVKLPGGKQVVVDAKVAFNGYLEAMEAKDESVRAKRLEAHARHVRQHVDDLGAKAYWEHFDHTPEFVVMFMPAETFLNAALEQDPTILERAFERNVVMATPATLVALLRTVAYTWRQEALAAEAQQVFTVGRELHKRLGTLGGHLTTLGKRLNSTVDAYNKFNSSLDSQVVTQARRFSALQGLEPSFETPPPLEIRAVPAHKDDVHAATDRSREERDLVLGGRGGPDLFGLIEAPEAEEPARKPGRGKAAG